MSELEITLNKITITTLKLVEKKCDVMKLIGNKILVKKVPLSKHSESGIYAPSEKSYDYKVLLIGNGVEHIKPGDVIRKHKFSDGIQIIYEGEDCLILNAKRDIDILLESKS